MADHLNGDLYLLQGPAEKPGDLFELAGLQQLEVIVDNLPCDSAPAVATLQLEQEAFAQIAGGNTRGIQRLNRFQGGFDIFELVFAG